MANYWIKLYHEVLHDPKMGNLSDHLWRRCIEAFLLAGEHGADGTLPKTEHMAWTLHTDVASLTADLEALAEGGIVSPTGDGGWMVTNFAKRQKAMSGPERAQRYRMQKRQGVRCSDDGATDEKPSRNDPLPGRHVDNNDGTTGASRHDNESLRDRDTELDIELELEQEHRRSPDDAGDVFPAAPEGVLEPAAVAEIAQLWESGTGRSVSSRDRAAIDDLMEEHGHELVLYAYREAARRRRMTLPYVRGVLKNAGSRGVSMARAAPAPPAGSTGQAGQTRDPWGNLPDVIRVRNWTDGSVRTVRVRGRNGDNNGQSAEQPTS